MKKNDLISVIVPCYNVEKYVEKTLLCLVGQTYKNIEILVIDDCSTDSTYSILKKFQKEHSDKIKLFKNTQNGGLAYTRNKGLEYAKGNYVGFIDSDDYIDSNYYEELITTLKNEKADIVITDIVLVDENGKRIGVTPKACIGDVNKINIISNGMASSSCNKLFKKEIIEKYPFLEGKINEDVAAILPALINSDNLAYTDKVCYYYVQRNTSIQNSKFSDKRYDMFDAVEVCLDRIKNSKDYEQYKEIILYHQLLMLYVYVIIKQDGFINRYNLIKKFIKRQNGLKVYNIKLYKDFLNTQNRISRVYYSVLVRLIKYKAAFLINSIIGARNLYSRIMLESKKIIKRVLKLTVIKNNLKMKDLIKVAKKQNKMKDNDIKVSVVVPNYNYEEFLTQRIYSILSQSVKIFELIILDDCSKDNSRKIIDEICNNINPYINVRKVYNKINSGGAFPQWSKGMKEAKGDYIWIAEADDYCEKNMLKELLIPIKHNKNIFISYVDTAFTDKFGKIILKTIKPEIDIMKTGHWNESYINNGLNEINNYAFLNNTIANVSSCLIKNEDYKEAYKDASQYKQAGDWIFYLNIMSRGDVSYIDKTLNYYKVHDTQITTNMNKEKHLNEIIKIYEYIDIKFNLSISQKQRQEKRIDFLKKAWNLNDEREGVRNV